MGPNARVDYNSPYLIVSSVVSYPSPISPIGWGHLHLSANFQNNKKEKWEGVGGGGGSEGVRADPMSFWIEILWRTGNPVPELTLTPRRSWLVP